MTEAPSRPDDPDLFELTAEDVHVEEGQPALATILGRRPNFARADDLQAQLASIIGGCRGKRRFKAEEGVSARDWLDLARVVARFLKAMEFRQGLYGLDELEDVGRIAKDAEALLARLKAGANGEVLRTQASIFVEHTLNKVSGGQAAEPDQYPLFLELLARVASIPRNSDYIGAVEIAKGRSRHHQEGEVSYILTDQELRSSLQTDLDAWWKRVVGTSIKAEESSIFGDFLNEIFGRMCVAPTPGHSETSVRTARAKAREQQDKRRAKLQAFFKLADKHVK